MTTIVPVPDSEVGKSATALIRGIAPEWLVQHSFRTYRFGLALLERVGQHPDTELLFVASMLHDAGLGTVLDDGVTPFHLRTAAIAASLMLGHDRSVDDASIVYDAIAMHLELTTADDPRPEVAGVHLGAIADVVGVRVDEIPRATLEAILFEHPRLDMKTRLTQLLRVELEQKPYCAIARLHRDLAILDRIRDAPFDE